jgi:hypothetical protein
MEKPKVLLESMFTRILLILAFLSADCLARSLSQGEIVPKFYVLLYQEARPSEQDEREFFGGDDSEVFRTALKWSGKLSSDTPVWDYLREHRAIFMTQGSNDWQRLLGVSSPFKVTYLKNPNKEGDFKVLVTFPGKKVTKSGYEGSASVLFTLGDTSYLKIGVTELQTTKEALLERVYNDKRAMTTDKLELVPHS